MSKNKIIVSLALMIAVGFAIYAGPAGSPLPITTAQAQDSGNDAAKKKTGADGAKKSREKRRKRRRLVQVDEVRIAPMTQTMAVIGRLVAVRSGDIAARIDAPVAEMKVDIGDPVKKNQIVARLVDERLKWDREEKSAELANARAKVETAKIRLALAKQELKRITDLKTSAAFSRARFDDKRLEVARYRAELVEANAGAMKARAALKLAETELRYTLIRAPYDGTITRRHTEAGAYVKEGTKIYTMISDQNLEIEADVPARRAAALKPGHTVQFELGRNGRYTAIVRAVVPEEDLRTRTWTVRFKPRFDKRPPSLAANQSATIHLPIGKGRKVLSMHKDALITSRGKPMVFVVKDRRAYARPVVIGEGIGNRFEVLSGLKQGDMVVTRGNERLKDGKRVTIGKTTTQ